jgi:hypothetical protein
MVRALVVLAMQAVAQSSGLPVFWAPFGKVKQVWFNPRQQLDW